MSEFRCFNLKPVFLVSAMAMALPVMSQQAPDAGQTLRQLQAAPMTVTTEGGKLSIAQPINELVEAGGPQFSVSGFIFEGNKQLDSARLQTLVQDALLIDRIGVSTADQQSRQPDAPITRMDESGEEVMIEDDGSRKPIFPRQMDMLGLSRVVMLLRNFYRSEGYPFAQAHLPVQQVVDGQVRIMIVEGAYDRVTALSSNSTWQAEGQKWLSSLKPGQVITQHDLERVSLLLGDLPGVAASMTAEQGRMPGTATVQTNVDRKNQHDGEVGLSNYGSKYSGVWQARVQANLNSPFMMGDQLSVTALHTDHKMWQGSLNYSAPLGYDGLRAQVGYSDTNYQLTKGFEGNSGNAQVNSASISYPLLRSAMANVKLSAGWQGKRLFNSRTNGAITETYTVDTVPLAVNFDQRDASGDGSMTYGMVSWSQGQLHKDDAIRQGAFQKWNADLSRIQTLPSNLSLMGRLVVQRANKNLDSSEGIGLGGAYGIRAYPTGESYGDEGWMTQFELRYAMGPYTPYAFYDHGRIKVNAKPAEITSPSPDQERAGAGFGMRYERQQWRMDAALAWRTKGGAPTSSQGEDPKPRAWLALSYKF